MKQTKIKVNADQYVEAKKAMGDLYFGKCVPTGYRGRQIFPDKDDPDNLADVQTDIREYYGLAGTNGLPEDGEVD